MHATRSRLASSSVALILAVTAALAPPPAAAQECVARNDISLGIVLDTSSSMSGPPLIAARDFAVSLIDQLNATGELVEAATLVFCAATCVDIPFQSPTTVRNLVATITNTCPVPGCPDGTGLFDSIVIAGTSIRTRTAPVKLLVVITDGLDSGGGSTLQQAANALAPPGIIARLVFVGAGSPELSSIATLAGPHVQALAATPANLSNLVSGIVGSTCSNFRPAAGIALSDAELRLGTDGFAVTFNGSPSSDVEDPDGSLTYSWQLRDPAGAVVTSASTMSFSHTFDDSRLPNTQWSVRLTVTDTDGSTSNTATQSFAVVGSPPDISVTGPARVQVGQPIELDAAPTTDVDGGSLTFAWTTPQRPSGSAAPTLPAAAHVSLPTDSDAIGSWTFRATATDDEGQTDHADVTVEVANAPPEIQLGGTTQVRTGETIELETSVTEDADGGDLSFRWDVVQSPRSGHVRVQQGYRSGTGAAGASLSVATTAADAGHWIFRLVATDDDGAADSEAREDLSVLVDGPPQAALTGPTLIGSEDFPLVLDGTGSLDPESPCPSQPHRCHDTLESRPVVVPSDPLRFTWSLVDMPGELWGSYTLGAVDDALGLQAHNPTLSVDYGLLEPGDWTFELEVADGEGNRASEPLRVAIADENGRPTALVSGPNRAEVTTGNVLTRDIIVTGLASHDRDNILDGASVGPGVGITRYDWELLQVPPGCTPPALPAGPNAHTFTLYAGGHVVDPPCQGIWRIELTVTDDDPTPLTDFAETLVGIGNCAQTLCIDYPTTSAPHVVELPPDTDVPILYRLDSTVYDAPELAQGLVVRLAIYHESDLTTPVYTALDPNMLASDRGGQLAFHWDGRGANGERPRQGRYTVEVTLFNPHINLEVATTRQPNSILIQLVDYQFGAGGDELVSLDALHTGLDTVSIPYAPASSALADSLRWHVYDGANREVHSATALPQGGTIEWNGRDGATGDLVEPGVYRIELEPFRRGVPAGTSTPHQVTLFRTTLTWQAPIQVWSEVWDRREPATLLITTTPAVTAEQLVDLGFPLTLHSDHTPHAGVSMAPLVLSDGEITGIFSVAADSGLAPFPTAEITNLGDGDVLVTFPAAIAPPPGLGTEDAIVEHASSDDAVRTPGTSNHDDSQAFDTGRLLAGSRQVGAARDYGSESVRQPPANRAFVIHAGTQWLRFALWGVETPARQVRQQADWFYYSGHGRLATGNLELPDGDVDVDDVRWDSDVEVAIIAGCSVLGIKDYRANHFPPGSQASYLEWLAASVGGLASPGEGWEDTGPDYLLGYAWAAPHDTQGTAEILEAFLAAVDAGQDVVNAWATANDPAVRPTGSNAAAIDASEERHRYCFWNELNTPAVWTCIDKNVGSDTWPDLP